MLIEPRILRFAKPSEFDEGKQIKIENFEELTIEEVTKREGRAPLYPPKDGVIYRLSFTQSGHAEVRTMDLNTPRFRDDLAGKVKDKGEVGILTRKLTGENKFGKPSYKWSWTKLEI